jgi:hypothetical protein
MGHGPQADISNERGTYERKKEKRREKEREKKGNKRAHESNDTH